MPFCEDCGATIFNGATCDKCGAVQTFTSNQPIPGFIQHSASVASESHNSTESAVESKTFLNLNQFQKNVLFVAVTVFILVMAGILVNNKMQERVRRQEEQKVLWRKYNIKILKELSGIGALSTEEQTRVDNAGDDLYRLQQVLLDIHQERITVWSGRMVELGKQYRDLQSNYFSQTVYGNSEGSKLQQEFAEAKENLDGYGAAIAKIRRWKPISFEDFRAGKLTDPGSSEHPKLGNL